MTPVPRHRGVAASSRPIVHCSEWSAVERAPFAVASERKLWKKVGMVRFCHEA